MPFISFCSISCFKFLLQTQLKAVSNNHTAAWMLFCQKVFFLLNYPTTFESNLIQISGHRQNEARMRRGRPLICYWRPLFLLETSQAQPCSRFYHHSALTIFHQDGQLSSVHLLRLCLLGLTPLVILFQRSVWWFEHVCPREWHY